jgi:hypothetical protein
MDNPSKKQNKPSPLVQHINQKTTVTVQEEQRVAYVNEGSQGPPTSISPTKDNAKTSTNTRFSETDDNHPMTPSHASTSQPETANILVIYTGGIIRCLFS